MSGWKSLFARAVFGRRARAALAAARHDLETTGVERAIATRSAIGDGGPRTWTLRGMARAIAGELERDRETRPCLPRAVALFGEARRLGYSPLLVLGVRRGEREVESHAWLELDGRPFLEDPATPSRYEVVSRLPR